MSQGLSVSDAFLVLYKAKYKAYIFELGREKTKCRSCNLTNRPALRKTRKNAHYKLKEKKRNTDIIDHTRIKNFNKDQFLNMYDRHNIVS